MQNLTAHLFKDRKLVLCGLNLMIVEVPNPRTGVITRSGIFNSRIGEPVEPGSYQILMSNDQEADIEIYHCVPLGRSLTNYFKINGEFRLTSFNPVT